MQTRRRGGLWLAIVAGAGACDRCTWRLEYVEAVEASSGDVTLTADASVATQAVTEAEGETGSSAATSSGGAEFDVGGSQSGSSGGEEDTSETGLYSSSGGSTSESGKGSLPPPPCGNGILDPTEGCDDGNDQDDDACPSGLGGCHAGAICGDGAVWSGVEECDDGNVDDYDACSIDCWAARTVFITSDLYVGDFGGVVKGDVLCQKAAADAGLPGSFMAWLSGGLSSPASRFKSDDFSGWYRRPDGLEIAHGWTGLTSGSIGVPIDMTEFGSSLSLFEPDVSVWTATEINGKASDSGDCGSWQGFGGAMIGRYSSTNGKWTSYTTQLCSKPAHLYCFQVADF